MHIETSKTKSERLQAIREKINSSTDPKEKTELGREARKIRLEQAKQN